MAIPSDGGSPFLKEVWGDGFILGAMEGSICISVKREEVPWSCELDAKTIRILAELFASLSEKDRLKLAKLLNEAAEDLRRTGRENALL